MLPRPPVPRTVWAAPCPNRLVFVLVLKPRGLVQRINRGYANSSDAPLLKCWRTGSGKKRPYLSRHVYAYRTFCSSLSTNLLLSGQASSFGPRLIVRSTGGPALRMMNYTRLMPIQIGSKVANFSKPTVLLSDCHRRIEMFLGVLHRIAELENRLLTKDEQGSLEKALRYFHEAAPKHTAEEEQSLFPRLRHNSQTEVQSVLRELERLESDHQRATPMHAEIELLGKCWLAVGHLTSEQLGRFRELVAHLISSLCIAHILNLRIPFCSRLPRASSPVQSNRRWPAKWRNDGRPQPSDRIGSPETLPPSPPVCPA